MLLDTYALSIAGRRANHEDAICAQPEIGLFVVAAARALAFEPGDRYPSVDALRRDVADAQRRRTPATAVDLGDWVRARLTVS